MNTVPKPQSWWKTRGDNFHIEAFNNMSSSSPRRHRKDVRVELSQAHRLAVPTLQSLHPRVDGTQMSRNDGIALPQDGQGAVCRRRRTLCRRTEQSVTDRQWNQKWQTEQRGICRLGHFLFTSTTCQLYNNSSNIQPTSLDVIHMYRSQLCWLT